MRKLIDGFNPRRLNLEQNLKGARLRDGAIALFLVAVIALVSTGGHASYTPEQAKTELEKTSLQYFLDNSHPVTKQVLDKAENFAPVPETNRVASIAAVGFGLAVVANAGERGLMDRQQALEYCTTAGRFARDKVARRKGWFLHFYDWETGERRWNAEYSTIDTALFMGGALYAAALHPGSELAAIVAQLYKDLDFHDAMTDGGARPEKRTLSMAFTEEYGYTPAQWHMYAEQILLLVLGMGHPTNPLPPDAWLAFERTTTPLPTGQQVMGLKEALFVHQYSQLFVDLRKFSDGFPNYHENGYWITKHHRDLRLTERRFKSLTEGFWGYSAGESPKGYEVGDALNYKGIVCVGCAVGSAVWMPEEIMGDVAEWMNGPYRDQIWGRYGFVDSLDLDQDWFSPHVLGITVGPVYMSLTNMSEETSFWKVFNAIPEIRMGLERAANAQAGIRSASLAH